MDLIHRRLHFRKPVILASDDFSEAANTALIGKSLDIGGVWTAIRSVGSTPPQVTSLGKAGYASGFVDSSVHYLICDETNYTNVKITGKLFTGPNISLAVGFIARSDGVPYVANVSGSFLLIQLLTNSKIAISNFSSGVPSLLVDDTSKIPALNTEYNCTLTLNGSNLTFDTPLGSVVYNSLPTAAGARYGIRLNIFDNNSPATVDNFLVETL